MGASFFRKESEIVPMRVEKRLHGRKFFGEEKMKCPHEAEL
jgi:hypothetical protein